VVAQPLTTVSSRPGTVGPALRLAWLQRRLLVYFAHNFNQRRYLRTWLGPVWIALRPGLTVGWQLFIFAVITRVSSGGPEPYPVLMLLNFAIWRPFSEIAFWVARSLELNRKVLSSARVSGLVMGVGALAPAVVDAVVTAGFLLVVLLVYLIADGRFYLTVSSNLLLAPLGIVLLLMLGLGIGLLLAVPGARARDVRFGLRFSLGWWYFLTPVVYPITSVPHAIRPLVECNPATGAIQMITDGLLRIPAPSLLSAGAAVIVCPLVFLAGLRTFAHMEDRTLDHL
jgi:lipopolysaccharide transport system permease protein